MNGLRNMKGKGKVNSAVPHKHPGVETAFLFGGA